MAAKKTNKKQELKKKMSDKDVNFCRRCRKVLNISSFYEATNTLIDTNGYMSVCKNCCQEIYNTYYTIYNNVEQAIHSTCIDLDLLFDPIALQATQNHIESLLSKGRNVSAVFGTYKSKVTSLAKISDDYSLRYKDTSLENKIYIPDIEQEDVLSRYDIDESQEFWGPGFTAEDYKFLNKELEYWQATHVCETRADLILLKEICIKILEIRNKRAMKENVSGLQKELQDLMKTASVDPAKANQASAGKMQEAWGVFIKDIEQFRPAEWHDKQEKYKDMDGLINYLKDYILRPLKNFVTGQRDFKVSDNIEAVEY